MLLREGDPADRFFLIRRGRGRARGARARPRRDRDRDARTPARWSAGRGCSRPYRWQLDARAVEPCELVAFDGACLRGKCETDHELGYQLMRRFAANLVDRLQATRLQLLDVYGNAAGLG